MIKIILFSLLAVAIIAALFLLFRIFSIPKGWSDRDIIQIRIGDALIIAEVAAGFSKKQQGLSGRESLEENYGMLFVFEKPAIHNFWMKGMLFPLDFIWLSGNTVVDISKNIPAPKEDGLPAYVYPQKAADKIIEVSAGTTDRLNIKIGDIAYFKK